MQELTVTGTHTTAELLESAGLTYTADDLLTPAADEIVPEGSGITVQRVTYNEYTVDEVVPTEIEEIPTSLFYRKQGRTPLSTARSGSTASGPRRMRSGV